MHIPANPRPHANFHIFYKKMRIDPLIILRVKWNSYVSYLRGKQPKYFLKNNIFFTTEPKDRCVVIMGFQKTRSLRSLLLRRGQPQSAITAKVPGGSEKRKSSNDGEPAHGQEKRRPSTYVEGKNLRAVTSSRREQKDSNTLDRSERVGGYYFKCNKKQLYFQNK